MNHIYRLCWNRSLRQWVVASELATRRSGRGASRTGKGFRRVVALVFAAGMPFVLIGPALAAGAPTGGQVVSGVGSISQAGAVTTIQQGSQTLQLNWQSFNVGAGNTVNFVQPGANSLAVNRILGSTPSAVLGNLNANGQVWLINPNGVMFGPSARVNVGGIVASTLDVDPNTLGSSKRRFSGNGQGSVINQGTITAADGGYVALIGNRVSNQGLISARLGTIALAGGSAATLTFDGSRLVHIQVDASTLNNLAENNQLMVADGGQVIMTAGAKDALLASAVNNTGKIRAQTVENHDGSIVLLGGMASGTVNVGGTLDASAPNGGNGGFIETSAAHFNLAPGTQITAAAPLGRAGTWLVDPTDLTIDANAASTISGTLDGGTNVVEQTTASGATGAGVQTPGNGDITVAAPISWTNAAASLTLDAYNAINVNAGVNGAGGVTLLAHGGNLTINAGGSIVGGTGVTLATGGNFVNNAGAAAVSTGTAAPWLIYSSDPTKDTTGGLAPSYIQYNAPYGTTPAASGNGFLYKLAPTITLTGLTGSVTKVYDGTNTANLTNANLQTTGLVNGDVIASATGTYATSNAGSNITVNSPTTFAGVKVTTAGGIPVYGYQATGLASADIGTITPAPLTVSIVNDPTKVYDGTTSAPLSASNYAFTGFVAGQGASVNQASSVSYSSSNAGTGIPVNATFTSTNFVANSGTNLANYTLPTSATGTGTITPAPLLISGLVAGNKVYDGTRAATLDTSGASLFGVISTDNGQVALNSSGASGNFVTPNVGNGISVVPTGFTLTGAKAGNYQISLPAYLAANITPKYVTITGVTASNKVYDATTTATLNVGNAAISGLVPSDAGNVTLSTSGSTGTFSQSDVGNNLAVSVNGMTLSGPAAGNYVVSGLAAGLTANITPAPLTITFLGSPTKVYDGSANATLTQANYTISGFVGGQSATIGQTSASYATPNAGTNIPITATIRPSDFVPAAGTSMSNYTFSGNVSSSTGIITPQPVQVGIVNNPTKVYDGNDVATLGANNYQVSGVIPGESITLNPYPASGTYASSNVGYWVVTANVPAGDYQAGPNTLLSNYLLPTTASGMGTIVKRQINPGSLTADITANPSKTYDGNNIATIPANDFTFNGFVPGQGATVNHTITGTYATKDVGQQPITASLSQSDLTANAGTDLNNYSFPVSAYGMGSILPAQLIVTIIGNPTKVYNGDTIARVNGPNLQINGFVSGEGASINPTAQFTYGSANVGTRLITGSLVPSNWTANSGTLLSNYLLPTTAVGPGTITPAPLYIINTYATNKVYDTTTADTLNASNAQLVGVVSSDTGNVTLNTSTSGTFAQANVGNNIAVSANGFSISGSAAGNYALQPLTGLTANITPAPLTVNGALANNKVYDSTTDATINSTNATLAGVLGSDNVTLSSGTASGTFITPNVGTKLAVTANGFTLSGAQAGNYTVQQPQNLVADITPRPLTVTITGNPVKQYDGTRSVTLGASDFSISGFVGGQSATVTQTAASGYLSPNVGTHVGINATLEPSDYSAAFGTNLSNYSLPTQATGVLGQITAKVINLTGTRVYDATTGADASLFSSAGLVNGVNGETLGLTGSGVLSTRNVGKQQPFANFGTLALTDGSGLASNYTLVGGTDWVTITPAMLTVLNTIADSKVYDGNRNANLHNALLSGVLGTDAVTLGNDTTGLFDTKNVGTNKPVSTSMTISGTDAGNYTLVQPTGITANITPLNAAVIAATGKDKQYDGTTTAQVGLSSTSVVAGDQVTFSDTAANFSQSDVGTNLAVHVSGISASGADAGNYVFTNTTADTTANITQRVLNLQGSRVYDATTGAVASLFGSNGTLQGQNGETLTLSGTGTLTDKNVGTQKPFAANGLDGFTLTGDGAAKASNYTLVGGNDWVTITPAKLTVSGTIALDKVYDGNTNAVLQNALLQGVLGSDDVILGNDTQGQFQDKNVGTHKAVYSSMTISGADAGNYTLTQPADVFASITPLGVNVVAKADNKVYDGNTNATVHLSSPGVIAGDNVTFSQTSANFGTKDVGTGKLVTVLGITEGGTDAGNYTFTNSSATTTADITPYVINLTGTRVYDATTGANASLFAPGGTIAGVGTETVALTGSGVLNDKNVGTQKAFANLGTLALGDGGNGGLASNYTLVGGTDWVTVTPAQLTVSGTTVNTKVYDATTNATLSGSVLNGVLLSDNVVLGNNTTGTFSDKNVGTGKSVTTAPMTIGGTDAGNYVLTQPTGLTGDIVPRPITVTAATPDKTYDGTTAAPGTTVATNGVLSGDTVNFVYGGAAFTSPNAGTAVPVSVTGILASGADAGNYVYNTTASTAANILQYVLNLTGQRPYDGTTAANANLFGTGGTLTGVNGETLSLTGSGVLTDKNAGTQKPFANFGTLTLNNGTGLASNYTLAGGTDWVTVTPLQVTFTASADSRYYNGTTDATARITPSGVLAGDNATFSVSGANFASPNAGQAIPVTVNIAASGPDAQNYTFANTATTAADIYQYILTLQGTRIYDGTTNAAATLFGNNGVLTGVNGETLTLSGTGTLASKNVNPQQAFTANGLAGYTLTGNNGALSSNYALGNGSGDWVNIIPKPISITAVGQNKVYDGTTAATLGSFTVNGIVAGDNANVYYQSPTFAQANVGTAIPISVSLYADGTDIGNYSFGSKVVTTSADITPRVLTITASAQNKVYDTTTRATLNGLSATGFVAGETGTFTAAGANFVTPNAGNGIEVDVTGITGSGSTLSNYTFNTSATTTADITPYILNLTATRVYDGTNIAGAHLFGRNGVLDGLNGETLTLVGNGTLASRNVGEKLLLTPGDLHHALIGNGSTLAGNYTLVGGVDWVTITPLNVTVNATGVNKVYDGTTGASVGLASTGILSGDNVSFSAQSSNFATPNVGNGIAVAVNGITASGADAGNYTFNTAASTAADITPYVLSLTGTRMYDATTGAAAGLFGSNGVLQGVNGETLTLSGTGTLADKNVGNQKSFAAGGLSGYTLTGNGAALGSNYTLAGGVDWVTVTPAPLTVVGTQTTNRVYDGTVNDALSGATLSGVLGQDSVALGNDTMGYFNNPAVGFGKPVNTAMTISGADAGNYVLQQPSGLTADIIAPTPPIPLGSLANVQAPLGPQDISTPYGTASDSAQGTYAGNQKQEEHPNERNVAHSDFHPGLALTVLNGGVRMPTN